MTGRRLIGMATALILAAAVVWLMSQPAILPPADSRQDDMADMPGMAGKSEGLGVRGGGIGAKKEPSPLTPHPSRASQAL